MRKLQGIEILKPMITHYDEKTNSVYIPLDGDKDRHDRVIKTLKYMGFSEREIEDLVVYSTPQESWEEWIKHGFPANSNKAYSSETNGIILDGRAFE